MSSKHTADFNRAKLASEEPINQTVIACADGSFICIGCCCCCCRRRRSCVIGVVVVVVVVIVDEC